VALRSFRIGSLHIGVRTNTVELDEAVSATLRDQLVEDADVPPNYSILRESPHGDHGRARFRIFIGCKHATTTRTLARAVAILCGYLEDHLPGPRLRRGRAELLGLALIHREESLLAPWQLRYGAPLMEARLEGHGIRILEHRSIIVDVESKEIVVEPRRLPPAFPGGDAHLQNDPGGRVREGRYPLRAWLVWQGWRWEHVTPGIAAAYGMTIAHLDKDPGKTLHALSRLVDGLPVRAIRTAEEVMGAARDCWM
jgi:hypothetical protein